MTAARPSGVTGSLDTGYVYEWPISEATKRLTLKVTGVKVMRARWAIAAQVFRLGAWIAGTNIILETEG